MVDAVSVEILGHLLETFHPPFIAILFHYVPIVGGETPVLPVDRKIIGWGTGLSVEIEIIGLCPGFHTVAADADRDISL